MPLLAGSPQILLVIYFLETALFGSYLSDGQGFIPLHLINRGFLIYTIFIFSAIPQLYLLAKYWEKAAIVMLLLYNAALFPRVLINAYVIKCQALIPNLIEHIPTFFS